MGLPLQLLAPNTYYWDDGLGRTEFLHRDLRLARNRIRVGEINLESQ
jgi:hypothetical protein